MPATWSSSRRNSRRFRGPARHGAHRSDGGRPLPQTMFAFRGPARRDATWWAVVWDKRGPSRSGAHGPLHLQALRPLRCRASLRGAASRHRRSGVFALQAARHRRKPPVFRPKKAPRRRKPPVFRPKEAPRRRKPTVFRPKKAPRHRKPTVFRPKTAPRRRKLAFEGYLSSPRRARRRWHARAPPPHRPALRPDPARAAGCTAQWRPSGGRRLLRRARRRAPGMKGDDALRKAEDRPAPPLCLAESRVNNPRRPVSSSCTIRGAATLMPTPSLARSSSPPMPPAASRTSPTSADRARRGGAGGVPPRSLCAWKNRRPTALTQAPASPPRLILWVAAPVQRQRCGGHTQPDRPRGARVRGPTSAVRVLLAGEPWARRGPVSSWVGAAPRLRLQPSA